MLTDSKLYNLNNQYGTSNLNDNTLTKDNLNKIPSSTKNISHTKSLSKLPDSISQIQKQMQINEDKDCS